MFLRKNVLVPAGRFGGAKLTFACDNIAHVYINGVKVASNDNFNKPTGKEVKEYLRRGENVLAVVAANSEAEGPAGFVARLDLELDRESPRIVSDASWVGGLSESAGWKTDLLPPPDFKAIRPIGALGCEPWTQVTSASLDAAIPLKSLVATNTEDLIVAKGFQVELLYDVPKDLQGSWVICALCQMVS